jgi:protocatechuate 3,4-dioxygenase beta subunit
MNSRPHLDRRQLLRTLVQAGAASPLAGAFAALAQTQAPSLLPTPACGAPAKATAAQTEGPYFKRSSPLRQSLLEGGTAGDKLTLTGRVLDTRCQPVAKALLDFWQADADGAYDNRGFRMRGHQFSDTRGAFHLDTVLPGLYPGRTRHIHVKVQAPGGPVLTTQLYFPDEAANRGDGIFSPALLVVLRRDAAGAAAAFDFVLG